MLVSGKVQTLSIPGLERDIFHQAKLYPSTNCYGPRYCNLPCLHPLPTHVAKAELAFRYAKPHWVETEWKGSYQNKFMIYVRNKEKHTKSGNRKNVLTLLPTNFFRQASVVRCTPEIITTKINGGTLSYKAVLGVRIPYRSLRCCSSIGP